MQLTRHLIKEDNNSVLHTKFTLTCVMALVLVELEHVVPQTFYTSAAARNRALSHLG